MDIIMRLFQTYRFLIEPIFFLILVIAIHYVEGKFYRRFKEHTKTTKTVWDSALLRALHTPFKVAIWLFGILYGVAISLRFWQEEKISSLIHSFREFCVTILVIWVAIRFIKEIEKAIIFKKGKGGRIDRTTLKAITQLSRMVVFVIGMLIFLRAVGVSLSGVLAFAGASGIGIGFAAKDLLANFFGGFVIFLDRPFAIGDWIRSPDRDIEGTVEHIGWRLTQIRTFDKRPLYVPNALFSTIVIENPSRMENRRIYAKIGLRYKDGNKVYTVLKEIETMLKNHEEIDTTKTLMVYLTSFQPSSLEFMIYTFTKTTNWEKYQEIQQDVFLKTLKIIEENGAACAFPVTSLDLPASMKDLPPLQQDQKPPSDEKGISS